LLPLIKKIEYFKLQKLKDHNLVDFANALKYESHQAGTIITDLAGSEEKLFIVISGTLSV